MTMVALAGWQKTFQVSPSDNKPNDLAVCLMHEASLTIIFQRSWMDRYDGLTGHHILDFQGRKGGVQAAEVGEVLKHRLDDAIGQAD